VVTGGDGVTVEIRESIEAGKKLENVFNGNTKY